MTGLRQYIPSARRAARPVVAGKLSQVVGLVLEAKGCRAGMGDLFELEPLSGGATIQAQVVGLRGATCLLMPLGETHGLEVGSTLRHIGRATRVAVGTGLLGSVVDALGRPLDGRAPPALELDVPLHGASRNPLRRRPIDTPLHVGVRALDGLLSLGRGQRVGIFAGGGVGKSTLLGMMVRNTQADVVVVGLVGERGREVEEFVNRTLGQEGLARSVVVAATSADPPLIRARGALYATAIAEFFRDRGLHVLLVMDSLTRYAMALREIGLAAGEPPTTKGYTPSVFAALPRLLERAGTTSGQGSITGVYTVLVEGDEMSEPVADAARAIMDGHIVLSRQLAERGHHPAIDVAASVSRVMPQVATPKHQQYAARVRELLAAYREAEDLVAVGAYQSGALPRLDEALRRMPHLERFLRQTPNERAEAAQVVPALTAIWESENE
ncbi:MAG: FliI/YscN family ATPase [Proteobacteria bacterium]|nr:FliI/YscN family ATPase [Pseudomonadota bacterium]